MNIWTADPASDLLRIFGEIHRTRMADVPICNARLQVEAVGFKRAADGHWAGVMVTPWAINLLRLPGAESWPLLPACSKFDWQFPSGNYEFTVAEEDSLGNYHLCSLFSPAFEFETHEQARLTALATALALFAEPMSDVPPATSAPTRRAFLGLRA